VEPRSFFISTAAAKAALISEVQGEDKSPRHDREEEGERDTKATPS